MLRYACILVLFFTHSMAMAQDRFINDAEAKKTLNSLPRMAVSPKKTALLLKLSDWYLLKLNRMPAELELAFALAKEANAVAVQTKDAPGQAGSYLQLAKLEGTRNLDLADQLAQKAIAAFASAQLAEGLGESYVALWSIRSSKGISYAERIQLLKQADSAFRISGNKLRQADCLQQMGDLTQARGNWATAMPYLQSSLQLYKSIGHKKLQYSYDLLGATTFGLGDYKTSLEYFLLAAKIAEETGDSTMMTCTINNHIGLAYHHIKDHLKAKSYYEKSMDIAIKYNDIGNVELVAYNYTNLLLKLPNPQDALTFMIDLRRKYPGLDTLYKGGIAGMMVDIYVRLNQLDKALPWCKIVEQELDRHAIKDYDVEGVLLQSLIVFYFKANDNIKAAQYVARFDSLCARLHTSFFEVNNLYYKFKLDSVRKEYVSAINYFQRHVDLKDSLFNERKSKEMNQLTILYETEKKDKNIRALQLQSTLQEDRIKQGKVVRNFILAGVSLLILVIFLLYKAYTIKQKSNQLLEAHQQEIHEKNTSLQKLVTEKEWLVKEIHHRVKNNLHMVVGLLASQAEFIKGQEALEAINESQHRIQAMSLIHQKLYQADNLSSIDMPSYIHELVEYLKTTFDRQTPIRFSLDIARVSFPLSHSIPIGLILNEAVTNAIKYAFPNGREGEITIRLTQTGEDHFILSIHDNGIGLPPGFNAQSNTTLGTTLMDGLSGDIGARFSMKSQQGTHIDIDFIVKPLSA